VFAISLQILHPMSSGLVAIIMVFSIPILALLMGGVKQYFEFRERQNSLGSSARALEAAVTDLQQRLAAVESERDALQRRVQNLETIVTNEAWDALHELSAPAPSVANASGSPRSGDDGTPGAEDAAPQREAEETPGGGRAAPGPEPGSPGSADPSLAPSSRSASSSSASSSSASSSSASSSSADATEEIARRLRSK
jgi:hypothetical protein